MWSIILLSHGHRVTETNVIDEVDACMMAWAWETSEAGNATIVYDPEGHRIRVHENGFLPSGEVAA